MHTTHRTKNNNCVTYKLSISPQGSLKATGNRSNIHSQSILILHNLRNETFFSKLILFLTERLRYWVCVWSTLSPPVTLTPLSLMTSLYTPSQERDWRASQRENGPSALNHI